MNRELNQSLRTHNSIDKKIILYMHGPRSKYHISCLFTL